MNKPTRRQHTVWRSYLRSWASGEQIWCFMAGKEPFRAALMKVGQERDFYRIQDMTDGDIALIHAALIAPMGHEIQRRAAERWILEFNRLRDLRRQLDGAGIDAAQATEAVYIEAEEQLHGEIERNALPLLERLKASDAFCLSDDDDYIVFVHFLMTQYFRTSRMLGNMRRGMGTRFEGTLSRSMGVLRHIMATAAGFTLFAERATMKCHVLVNDTDVPLITGDQPVINMLAVDLPADAMAKDCEFYYPLSPSKALVILVDDRFAGGRICEAHVAEEFNRLIALSAERQVYAASESDLANIKRLVGKRQ
ncbi:DUF4238 domain-containing protein [Pseudoxanthomonas wuyuanensis]